jgi:hypothetical protein
MVMACIALDMSAGRRLQTFSMLPYPQGFCEAVAETNTMEKIQGCG